MIRRQNYHDWIGSLINDEPKISISVLVAFLVSRKDWESELIMVRSKRQG